MGLEWMDRAACVGLDPTLFEVDTALRKPHPVALATCASCPVFAECEADVQTLAAPGVVRAGSAMGILLAGHRRARLPVGMNQDGTWRESPGHGTHERYRQGCRCPGCMDAHSRLRHPNPTQHGGAFRDDEWRTASLRAVDA